MTKVGFLLAEDEALKAKFSELTVPDPNEQGGQKRVKVWYGMPSTERERQYPFISLDLIDIEFAAERAHDLNQVKVDWWPSYASTYAERAVQLDPDVVLDVDEPYGITTRFQPYNLYYQVATHTREPLQDRYLNAQMLSSSYAPLSNIGYLYVPADDTHRWLDNLGWNRADYIDNEGKNVHRKVFNLMVTAHMEVITASAFAKVQQLQAVINGTADGEQYASFTTVRPENQP